MLFPSYDVSYLNSDKLVFYSSSRHFTFDELSELSSCESQFAIYDSECEEDGMDISVHQKSIREVQINLNLPSLAENYCYVPAIDLHKSVNIKRPSWTVFSNSSDIFSSKLSSHSSDSSTDNSSIITLDPITLLERLDESDLPVRGNVIPTHTCCKL